MIGRVLTSSSGTHINQHQISATCHRETLATRSTYVSLFVVLLLESTMATTGAMCATSGILDTVVHSPHIQLMTETLFGIVKAVMKTPRPPPDIDICF